MPEVLANSQAHPAEAGVHGPEAVAPGEVALLLEHPVGRQVDLPVVVGEPAAVEQRGGVVVDVLRAFLHVAYDDGHGSAGFRNLGQDGAVLRTGGVRDDIF